MLVKIHNAYRTIVAVCDSDLIGQKFEEGTRQLDLTGDFFKGEEKTLQETQNILEDAKTEDATFNLVGHTTCNLALRIGLIEKSGIIHIQGIPIALGLL